MREVVTSQKIRGALRSPETRTVTALRARLPDAWFWDGSGTSPYLGMLALARHIVVTEDSVSMTSEAIATGKPVYAARLAGGGWPSSNRRCARTGYCAPSTDDSPSGNTGRSTRPRASRPRSTVGLETLTDYRTGTRPQGPIQAMCRMFVAPGVPKGARALTVAGEYRRRSSPSSSSNGRTTLLAASDSED